MRVAYFTAGTIGAGHHVRGIAVGRGLARASPAAEYRTFAPALAYPGARGFGHAEVPVPRADLEDPQRAPESALGRALAEFRPDLLLVDMFWAPVWHLLPSLGCEAWLLLRKCPPLWFAGPSPTMRFDPSRFARTFAIEPGLEGVPSSEAIEPIVVANVDECRPAGALRSHVGIAPGVPLHVVVHAGRAGERAQLERESGGAVVLDLFADAPLFPAAEWLGGADRVSAGAGYNAFWEARWLGYAGRTTFTPFPRPIDDQAWRVRACGSYVMRENGADALARATLGR